MSPQKKRLSRKQLNLQPSFAAVDNKQQTIRGAAASCYMPVTTFYRSYKDSKRTSVATTPSRRATALTAQEELTIVRTLKPFANRGYHLEREDLLDCVEIIVDMMPTERRDKLPFKNGLPSVRFARCFERRHKEEIRIGRPSMQEAKRFAATIAENLTSYLAELQAVIRENGIDSRRIVNLDETGISPDKDALGISKRKQYGTRSAPVAV